MGSKATSDSVRTIFAFFAARKRNLGQGNVFTPVCHSVHRGVCIRGVHGGGGLHPGGLGRPPAPSETTGYGHRLGGTHPTGMRSCQERDGKD